jgi:hypothetical protein
MPTAVTIPALVISAAATVAAAAPAGGQGPAPAERPLEVTSNVASGQWMRHDGVIELRLSRGLDAGQERVAVVIGNADWTELFESAGGLLRYRAGPVQVPAGESSLTVYVVSPVNEWRQVAQWPMRVLAAGGFEKAEIVPKVEAANLGQVAEDHAPAASRTVRKRCDSGSKAPRRPSSISPTTSSASTHGGPPCR